MRTKPILDTASSIHSASEGVRASQARGADEAGGCESSGDIVVITILARLVTSNNHKILSAERMKFLIGITT